MNFGEGARFGATDDTVTGINRLSFWTVQCVREVLLRQSVKIAAERLGVTSSAVSQQISKFEKFSGVAVLSRTGNTISVRNDKITEAVFSVAAAQDELRRLTQGEKIDVLRVGICDHLGAFYCVHQEKYNALAAGRVLHVAKPTVLMELFSRGKLDLVIRPLYHNEQDADLMHEERIAWVTAADNERAEGAGPLDVVLESSLSAYSHYVDRQLAKMSVQHQVVARLDDHMTRLHFILALKCYAPVPAFLLRAVAGKVREVNYFGEVERLRFGVLYHSGRISFKAAGRLFDMVLKHIQC
ncbi:MAG: hypothetical protein GAK35_01623 [Herbaspirillum frisingense]|uniref:HTH lysR-type domain-containing protein n=1 Tax=Herbaspirillum frisingense TaxID=92645 RepID=A0A7V8FXX3_9BURK|nr:MAG: hypothetical protein GAK35_01623 [Herbaspirillum frisingense]